MLMLKRWVPALAMLLLAMTAAAHHPVAPVVAVGGVMMATGAAWRWPFLWLFAVPAGLPWLNFAPWTGWTVVSEFDLWTMAWWAGAWLRRCDPVCATARPPPDLLGNGLVVLLAASAVVGIGRGLQDAGSAGWDWFGGYADPVNTWRVANGTLQAVAWWPLLRWEVARDSDRAARLLMRGMMAGLMVVVLACMWERYAYTRLFDFSYIYRTTALFWEMHVGGGAIDTYLVLAWPVACWAAVVVGGPWRRVAAWSLLVGALYAVASTFSRGVHAAVLVGTVVLAISALRKLFRLRMSRPWVAYASSALSLQRAAIVAGVVVLVTMLLIAALGPRSFMALRWAHTSYEVGNRWMHWMSGVETLQTPAQWLLGQGLGRIPAHLQSLDGGRMVAGSVRWHPGASEGSRPYVVVEGPREDPDLRALFALVQRVPLMVGQRHAAEVEFRSASVGWLQIEVCERHLLYDRRCQGRSVRVGDTKGQWLRQFVPLNGSPFTASPSWAPRLGFLALSVPAVGAQVDVRSVQLRASGAGNLVRNGDFGEGLARWIPAAQFHFRPWHLDSLYVESLVERGVVGLVLLLAMLAVCAWRLWRAPPSAIAAVMSASLVGVTLVGGVSSVLDVPRVATLFWLYLLFALCWARPGIVHTGGCASDVSRGV